MSKDFEPKIVYFLCSWCGSGGAETAAAEHLSYPENVVPFRVNCTGSLSTVHMLRAIIEGADGIGVSGCHPGDCHYNDGNFRFRRKMALTKSILTTFGLEPERVLFRYVAHGESQRFVDTAAEMNDVIKDMGPNFLKTRTDT